MNWIAPAVVAMNESSNQSLSYISIVHLQRP